MKEIFDSAAGTILGVIVLLIVWAALDWWFDARATVTDYEHD